MEFCQLLSSSFTGLTIKDCISFILGASGAFLGIYNTWRATEKDKVKIKVVPVRALLPTLNQTMLGIIVTNYSTFPVIITEIGLLYRDNKMKCVIVPTILDGGGFPRKLEPRTHFTGYWDTDPSSLLNVSCAYATTACGVIGKGNSEALKDFVSSASEFITEKAQA